MLLTQNLEHRCIDLGRMRVETVALRGFLQNFVVFTEVLCGGFAFVSNAGFDLRKGLSGTSKLATAFLRHISKNLLLITTVGPNDDRPIVGDDLHDISKIVCGESRMQTNKDNRRVFFANIAGQSIAECALTCRGCFLQPHRAVFRPQIARSSH